MILAWTEAAQAAMGRLSVVANQRPHHTKTGQSNR